MYEFAGVNTAGRLDMPELFSDVEATELENVEGGLGGIGIAVWTLVAAAVPVVGDYARSVGYTIGYRVGVAS